MTNYDQLQIAFIKSALHPADTIAAGVGTAGAVTAGHGLYSAGKALLQDGLYGPSELQDQMLRQLWKGKPSSWMNMEYLSHDLDSPSGKSNYITNASEARIGQPARTSHFHDSLTALSKQTGKHPQRLWRNMTGANWDISQPRSHQAALTQKAPNALQFAKDRLVGIPTHKTRIRPSLRGPLGRSVGGAALMGLAGLGNKMFGGALSGNKE